MKLGQGFLDRVLQFQFSVLKQNQQTFLTTLLHISYSKAEFYMESRTSEILVSDKELREERAWWGFPLIYKGSVWSDTPPAFSSQWRRIPAVVWGYRFTTRFLFWVSSDGRQPRQSLICYTAAENLTKLPTRGGSASLSCICGSSPSLVPEK